VIFTPIVSASAPAGLNVTSQQFKALFSNGTLPLSMFTGNSADTAKVFATGRNDGSGTRTTYMAESGLGITSLVQQYLVTATSGSTITAIRRVPAANGTNASTIWGQDVDGNGGYNSGATLRGDLARTSASTSVLDVDDSDIYGTPQNVVMLSFVGAPDAQKALTAAVPAKVAGWNGSTLTSLSNPIATAMNAADQAKIREGAYSAWGYENLYYSGSLSLDEGTFYSNLKTSIASRLAANPVEGIVLSTMHVSRPDDGAPITP
jgi:hypothetical protein